MDEEKKSPWVDFLLSNSRKYKELSEIKRLGWENRQGDSYFAQQRNNADHASERLRYIFFQMMQKIGDELQEETRSLVLETANPRVLDLCMAPGGYTSTALKLNPDATVTAITLPIPLGGHEVLLSGWQNNPKVQVEFRDISMLAGDLDVQSIPDDHPDALNFCRHPSPWLNTTFDLIFCDGQVLRNHPRASYREKVEATRLLMSQLTIMLRNIRPGATAIILLHKVDSWDSAELISQFKNFAQVQLFKPKVSHAKRSSFYLVAQQVNPDSESAKASLSAWKMLWEQATFKGSDTRSWTPTEDELRDFVTQFGERFIELAEPIWDTQLKALSKATFIRGAKKSV